MTHRNRAKSPYDSILDDDDDYSDDFDDDATDVGTKRYKTKSPLNRTGITLFRKFSFCFKK
jgi:hypothetical protein